LIEHRIHTMGTEVRLYVGAALDKGVPDPESAAAQVEADLREFDRCLSRFLPESELSRLNRDPCEQVPVSALMREAVRAGLWGAERTGGLVDPTLLEPLQALGYAATREGVAPPSLTVALAAAPLRRPAGPDPRAGWRSVEVLDEAGAIRRPPGLLLDTGGTGKGLAADRAARRLHRYSRYAVDCGGDVRVGGRDPDGEPVQVEIRHPLSEQPAAMIGIRHGAVATSGLDVHLWASEAGFEHHLVDPATGRAAWTGLICAAARAPTALEADVLAKAALLSGPEGADEFLGEHGGLVVLDDGEVQSFGPLHDPPRLRVPPTRKLSPGAHGRRTAVKPLDGSTDNSR
jgi:FAD:protein FMN transferase